MSNEKKEEESSEKTEKSEMKTKDEYLAQIEQLENELQLEQKISESLGEHNDNNEEILKLQNDLEQKTDKLEQLIETNNRQEEALSVLRKQLDKQENKNKNNILLTSNFSNAPANTKVSFESSSGKDGFAEKYFLSGIFVYISPC